jgi:hypothetical protein
MKWVKWIAVMIFKTLLYGIVVLFGPVAWYSYFFGDNFFDINESTAGLGIFLMFALIFVVIDWTRTLLLLWFDGSRDFPVLMEGEDRLLKKKGG